MAFFLRFDLKEHSKRAARLAGSARGRLSPNWIASALSAITTFQLEQWQGHLRSQTEQCTRSEEHTSALQSLMSISYAVFCLKKKTDYKSSKHNTIRNTD